MHRYVRRGLALSGGVVALLVGTVVVPAVGTSAPPSTPATPASVVRLHLGTDGDSFAYGSTLQPLITAKGGCEITSAQPVMALSSPSQMQPGLADDSIGVKAKGGANGTPCGQVSSTERLTLRPGTTLGGRSFRKVRLDLEMTGNAIVSLTLTRSSTGASATYTLQTGGNIAAAQASETDFDRVAPYEVSSSPGDEVDGCAAPNSSGPNSGGNDNCLWTVQPGSDFDTVTLSAAVGTVALEGGSDFANSSDHESLFYLSNTAPVATNDVVTTAEDTAATGNLLANDTDADGDALAVASSTSPSHGQVSLGASGAFTYTPDPGYTGPDSFTYTVSDGEATASATVQITVYPVICSGETVTDAEGAVSGSFTRLSDGFDCKRYALDAVDADGTVLFKPEGASEVTYRGFVQFAPAAAPTLASGGAFSLLLEYDPTGGTTYEPVQWCIDPQFGADDVVTSATLPAGQAWCIANADLRPNADGDIATMWQVYGVDDPRFK